MLVRLRADSAGRGAGPRQRQVTCGKYSAPDSPGSLAVSSTTTALPKGSACRAQYAAQETAR